MDKVAKHDIYEALSGQNGPKRLWTGKKLAKHPRRGRDGGQPGLDRRILALAVPALGSLLAEPLLILVDSAVIGHLGTGELAGLAVASTVLITAVGLCVFLAYATTAAVSRRAGAGDLPGALQLGMDGIWLALALGIVLAAGVWVGAPALAAALGEPGQVAEHAVTYLRWSAPGLPGMLIVLAATGALRGLLDTRTPLWVAGAGAVLNAALTLTFVLVLGWGIGGAGLGTAITQWLMAVVLVVVLVRGSRKTGTRLTLALRGVLANARGGLPLFVRTLSLRAAIVVTVFVAGTLGTVALAGYQVVAAIWGLVAFALDALAIAAQALIGSTLGAGDVATTRAVLRRTLAWGTAAGAVLGAGVAGSGWWLAQLFTTDPDVRYAIAVSLVVVAVFMPMAGWVFVLDGVLIGAGDGRYLALVGLLTLVIYVPVALLVERLAPPGAVGLAWLWASFAGVFMLARAVTTGWRARGTAWMVTGA